MIVKNEAGEDIEVFNQAELDAKIAEKDAALTKAQEESKAKDEALEKLQNKDTNFANLRQAKEKAEAEATEAKAKLADAVNTVKADVLGGMLEDVKKSSMESLAGGDEELKKKIEFQFNRLADKVTNKAELDKKVLDAYRLATEYRQPVMNSSIMSSAGAGRVGVQPKHNYSPEEAELAAKFGLSAEDLKKHGGK